MLSGRQGLASKTSAIYLMFSFTAAKLACKPQYKLLSTLSSPFHGHWSLILWPSPPLAHGRLGGPPGSYLKSYFQLLSARGLQSVCKAWNSPLRAVDSPPAQCRCRNAVQKPIPKYGDLKSLLITSRASSNPLWSSWYLACKTKFSVVFPLLFSNRRRL